MQHQPGFHAGLHAFDNALAKLRNNGIFLERDSDDVLRRYQNADWDGIIYRAVIGFFRHRRVQNNQCVVVLGLDTRRLLFVQSRTQKIGFQSKLFDQPAYLPLVGIDDIDPAAFFEFLQLPDASIDGFVVLDHRCIPLLGDASPAKVGASPV